MLKIISRVASFLASFFVKTEVHSKVVDEVNTVSASVVTEDGEICQECWAELNAEALQKAAACTTIDEARNLYCNALEGSEAERIYRTRLEEIAYG